MNTSDTGRRLAISLLIFAFFVIPASAQQTFSSMPGDFGSPDDNGDFLELNVLIEQVRLTESLPLVPPVLTSVQWEAYGDRLATALASDHRGLKHSALRLIIAYSEKFAFDEDAVFDVMRIYRDGDTERVRRMAVVALAQMKSDFAMKYLERSVRFEESDQIKHTIRSVLYAQRKGMASL